jgi:uncharacterized protein (DUF58 family)
MTPGRSGLAAGVLIVVWVVTAAIFVGGAAGGALIGLGLGLVLMLLLALLGPLDSVTVERILPAGPVRAGELVTVVLRIRSARWWPWLLLRVTDAGNEVHLLLLSRRVAMLPYRIPDVSRGVHNFGEVRLTSTDPLGLVQRTRLLRVPGELVVWPSPAPMSEVRLLLPAACRTLAALAAGGETAGVRPYLPGDPPQRIHWPASARTGSLLTRQSGAGCAQSLDLVVDASEQRFEQALSQAAGLVGWGLSNHFRVALRAWDRDVPPARGREQLERLMRVLATCRAVDSHGRPVPLMGQDRLLEEIRGAEPGSRVIRLTGEGLP